jgi:hypothetical protein
MTQSNQFLRKKVYLRKDQNDDNMFILEHVTIYGGRDSLRLSEQRHADALLHIDSLANFVSEEDYRILDGLERGMRVEINLTITVPEVD